MRRLLVLLVLALSALTGWTFQGAPDAAVHELGLQALPAEVQATLKLIQSGGPYPYRQDGTTFKNRERRLPERPHGYYREYTVPTPGSPDRGARRIISGGDPPTEFFYTADHYRSFRPVEVQP